MVGVEERDLTELVEHPIPRVHGELAHLLCLPILRTTLINNDGRLNIMDVGHTIMLYKNVTSRLGCY